MESQTKSCTGTLRKPGHHLKCNTISAEPSPVCSSTSDSKHEELVHNVVQKENPTPSMHNFMAYVQTSMEISKTWTESKESNLVPKKEKSRSYTECTPGKPDVLTVFAEDSCKVVREKENVLEDTPTCGQSHFLCDLSSSDTNNTSLMISNIDKETREGRIITPNVGSVSNDTSAHYNLKVQSQSLIINSSPETGVTDVLVLENTSEDRKSEVNFGSLQTSTDFFEKETTLLEPCKDHTTHQTNHECKIGLDCKSSCLLNNASPLAKMKKKKRKNANQEPFKNLAQDVQDTRKNSRRLKRKTKTEKMRSRPTNIRKSHRTAITVRKGKKLLQNRHAKIKENRFFRKKRKVKRPALVSDSGQNQCMNTSKMSTNRTGKVFKTSSGPQPNIFQKGSSKARRLLKCFEEPLKTDSHPENFDDMMSQSEHAKDFCLNASNKLLKMASDSQNSTNVTGSRKQALWNKSSKEKPEITELNGDAGFELSLQSTVKTTGFHSCHKNAFYTEVEDKKSRNLLKDVNVKASDKHQEERSERNVGGSHSAVQNVDGFTQYCDKDCVTTQNKDVCKVPDAVKSTKLAKKLIQCKYCSLSFRHISAYMVHQRIHTGHKPYRCELCSKSFAQLSKLKSHRCVHVHSVSLPCPCCGKKFSEKKDLIAHFTTHVKDTKRNKESDQQDKSSKSDAPCSKSKTCNISSNKFPAGYIQKIHKHDQDKPVSCKNCGKEFSTSSKLAVHERTHWPVKPYACSICAKGFTQINALKKHSRKHTGETPFSCSHCHLAFFDLPALRVHQLSKLCNRKQSFDLEGFLVSHGVDGEVNTPTFFKCQICKQLYQKWCQYTLHLQTHTKSSSYLCFSCGQSYEKDSEVSFHCRVCCQKSGEEVACGSSLSEILHSDPRNCTNLKEGSPTGMYSVEASKSNSPSSANLHKNSQTLNNLRTEHIEPESSELVKTPDLPETETVHLFDDDRVPASPTSTLMSCASLNESLECVETSPSLWRFKCPHCGQRYKRYRTLRLHMQTHVPAFRYVCSHCGRTFKKWNSLWLHQRIHRRKGRRYSCPQCNVQFHIFSAYKMHLQNHAKERPYACPLCSQTFSHEEALHVHQCTSLHQSARKLKCDVCARSFSSSTNLVKHGLFHNGATSYRCLLCVSSYTNNESLQDHLNVHDNTASLLPSIPSKPITFLHKCNRCKSSFSTGDLLYAHQLCHTGDLKRQVRPNQSSKSTSVSLEGARASTSVSVLSSLNLDAIPKETLFKYPHPDKLYVPPHLSRRSKNLKIIYQDSMDEDLEQESISTPVTPNSIAGPPGQNIPQEYSETAVSDQPQSLESQESVQSRNIDTIPVLYIDPVSENFIHSVSPQTARFFETSVILGEPTTTISTVNPAENERQDEIFECADCSEKLHSLMGLYEHYFLHAVGNTNLYRIL
ncbi:uncharacterized protein si:ch73-347e22.4 isoform X2 [Clarias gariepinus]|nr:uncharacterized protein si:ch73-347e22.4 isoform X2 [Clarias gariepinus]